MSFFVRKRMLCIVGAWFVGITCLYGQEADTTRVLNEVEVVAKSRPSVTRQAAPLQVVGKTEIDRLGLQEVSDAVKRFSGVTVKDYGGIGGLKTVSIRSLGAQHTAVSYDGVTISDTQSGQVDISRFSLDNVESVSLTIGQTDEIFQTARTYASAGALNIRTETPRFTDHTFHAQASVKAGSFGLINPFVRYEQQLSKTYSLSWCGDWMRADGQYPYTLTNGDIVTEEKRRNSDIETFRTELNLFADWKGYGKLQLKGYWFDSDRGLPGSVILYNDYHKERLQNRNGFTQALYENQLSEQFTLKTQAKFDYAWTRYRDFHSKYIDGQQTDVYTQREYYLSAAGLYRPHEHLSFSLAEDVFRSTLDATTPKCVFPERLTSLTALAAQFSNSRLSVTASLLGTFITEDIQTGDPADDRKRLSPAASVSYKILRSQNLRVRASYKDIFRTPTFNDLYYDRIGSRSLKPEKATQYNVGLTWSSAFPNIRLDYISLTADGYYNSVKDKIVALPTLFIWKMMNMGEVAIKGLDTNLSARISLPASLYMQVDGSYTWQQAQDVTDPTGKTYKHQLPYTPEHSGSVSASLENPWVNVSWTLTSVGERYALPQNIEMNRIPGYTEHQLSFNKTVSIRHSSLRLQAEILNLTDVTYDVIRYYPMPGRSFRATVKYSF